MSRFLFLLFRCGYVNKINFDKNNSHVLKNGLQRLYCHRRSPENRILEKENSDVSLERVFQWGLHVRDFKILDKFCGLGGDPCFGKERVEDRPLLQRGDGAFHLFP